MASSGADEKERARQQGKKKAEEERAKREVEELAREEAEDVLCRVRDEKLARKDQLKKKKAVKELAKREAAEETQKHVDAEEAALMLLAGTKVGQHKESRSELSAMDELEPSGNSGHGKEVDVLADVLAKLNKLEHKAEQLREQIRLVPSKSESDENRMKLAIVEASLTKYDNKAKKIQVTVLCSLISV